MLVARATGSFPDDAEYRRLRQALVADDLTGQRLPRFVRTCRDLGQFWGYIKGRSDTYQGRREHIWEAFRGLLDSLEGSAVTPSDPKVSESLESLDADAVAAQWRRALERRSSDPEGAITAARTLLESVCKHILDDLHVPYSADGDLPALYKLTAETLNLAPSQYTEEVFKRILGGCHTVVNGLASVRNRLSDSHGHGRAAARPAPRHAELAVNLAGAVSSFLVATWMERTPG